MRKFLIPALIFAFSMHAFAHIPAQANGQPVNSIAPMLEQITPAVVNIAVEKQTPQIPDPFNELPSTPKRPKDFSGVGSGIIIDAAQGLIVTNAHVVQDQKVMIVTLKNGRRYHATLIGEDDGFDIAVIKINAQHLVQMNFDDSNKLQVGDFVLAIGSPFGLTQTVTSGVISALNRSEPQIEGFQSFIQTDAPINPGNSGGALLDLQGKLIGMNTAIYSPTMGNIGIGFAIPSDMVKSVADQLIKYGKVEPGMLGVLAQDITPELADALGIPAEAGVIITQVSDGTPAAQAGLKAEDVIQKVNGVAVKSSAQLHNIMGIMRPGTKATIELLREHKAINVNVTVGNTQELRESHNVPYLNGMRLTNFSDLEPDGSEIKGALITTVNDSSEGALAGLTEGDVIVDANGSAINDVKQLITIAKNSPQRLLLKISRGAHNQIFYAVIEKNQ